MDTQLICIIFGIVACSCIIGCAYLGWRVLHPIINTPTPIDETSKKYVSSVIITYPRWDVYYFRGVLEVNKNLKSTGSKIILITQNNLGQYITLSSEKIEWLRDYGKLKDILLGLGYEWNVNPFFFHPYFSHYIFERKEEC